MMTVAALLFFAFRLASGHGRLMVPTTRKPTGYENDPVPGFSDPMFVCRNDLTTPASTITAGSSLTLRWDFGAAHVGDCAVFISYDYNAAKADQKYFKIANLFDCKSQNKADVPIVLPSWLPAGQAVLRWDWYALHQYPNVEFYSQCADVTIVNNGQAANINTITKYSIIAPPVYPQTGRDGVGYRNPFANSEQFMTGPNCANGFNGNSCSLTAPGTTGYVDVGDLTPVQSPTAPPTEQGAQPTPPPTLTPECITYEVVSGDSLTSIAAAFTAQGKTVSSQEICDFNKLGDCNSIDIGDDLMIPCETCGCSPDTRPQTPSPTSLCIQKTPSPTSLLPELGAAVTENEDLKGKVTTLTLVLVLTILILITVLICLAVAPGTAKEKFSNFSDFVTTPCNKADSKMGVDAEGNTVPKGTSEETELPRRATVTKLVEDGEGKKKAVAWKL